MNRTASRFPKITDDERSLIRSLNIVGGRFAMLSPHPVHSGLARKFLGDFIHIPHQHANNGLTSEEVATLERLRELGVFIKRGSEYKLSPSGLKLARCI